MRHRTEGWLKFMRDELRYTPDKPMRRGADSIEAVVADVSLYRDTSVRSCHGVGKTAMDAACLLTAMALVPNLSCMQVAPTWRQVKDVLWNEIRKWFYKSKVLPILFDIADKAPRMESRFSPHTWYARGVSSAKAVNVEGEHNQRVFLIIDEAKGVHDSIIEGAQGMLTNVGAGSLVWQLWSSTPSPPKDGYKLFYKSHTKLSFKRHKITAKDSPRVSKRWVEQMISFFGEDSQIVQARVHAEFPLGGADILIGLREAEMFYQEDAEPEGPIVLGVDVARYGDDESVIAVWQGFTLVKLIPFEKKNTKQVSDKVIHLAMDLGAQAVAIDDIGVGGGVTDQVEAGLHKKINCHVLPFTASSSPRMKTKFKNRADEVWWAFAEALKEQRINSAIQDEMLEGQLSTYKIDYTTDNRIHIIWPQKNSERLASDSPSPDRGDATIIGWWAATLLNGALEMAKEDEAEEATETKPMASKGMRNRQF